MNGISNAVRRSPGGTSVEKKETTEER